MPDLSRIGAGIERDGFSILPSLLIGDALEQARAAVDDAIATTLASQQPRANVKVDPNDRNIRLTRLPEHNALFTSLLRHPLILSIVDKVLGPGAYVSNFTGNVAFPGSGSMRVHSDQALAVPPPWNNPLSMNIIWCIDDVSDENGATRYLPGSHRFRSVEDVPSDADERMIPFEAPAGTGICMEGRLWHTSGANRTADRRRAMLFAYYVRSHIRGNVNWDAILSEPVKERMDDEDRRILGMGPVVYHPPALDLVALDASASGTNGEP